MVLRNRAVGQAKPTVPTGNDVSGDRTTETSEGHRNLRRCRSTVGCSPLLQGRLRECERQMMFHCVSAVRGIELPQAEDLEGDLHLPRPRVLHRS